MTTIIESKAFQAVAKELERERQRNRELEIEIMALRAGRADAGGVENIELAPCSVKAGAES